MTRPTDAALAFYSSVDAGPIDRGEARLRLAAFGALVGVSRSAYANASTAVMIGILGLSV